MTDKVYIHPMTGEVITLDEAIELCDEYNVIMTRQYMTIEEAKKYGYKEWTDKKKRKSTMRKMQSV